MHVWDFYPGNEIQEVTEKHKWKRSGIQGYQSTQRCIFKGKKWSTNVLR